MIKYADSWETHIFHTSFFNMDFSLIMKLTHTKTAIHVAETHKEGRVSLKIPMMHC